MKRFKNIESFIEGKAVFCGIDVHKKFWLVCIYCDNQIIEERRFKADSLVLLYFLARYCKAREINCVYEAGFSGFWLYHDLLKHGHNCIVTPPGLTPQTTSKVKTDKLDARKLAMYHAGGLLKSVWVPDKTLEADRRICRRRRQLVIQQTRAKNYVQSFLQLHNLKRPEEIKSNWSQAYVAWLGSLQLEEESDAFTLKQYLRNYLRIHEDLLEITECLQKLSKKERYQKNYKILTSAPGIGLISGMIILLEVFDFERFDSADQFSSYLGLTPSQFSSGSNVRLGHITRQGSAELRRVLVECAWTVIRRDPFLAEKYNRIRARGTNGKKAIVAIARSFAVRLRRALLDGTGYVIGVC